MEKNPFDHEQGNTEMSTCNSYARALSCKALDYEHIMTIKKACPELDIYFFLLLNTKLSEDTLKHLICDQEITKDMRGHFLVQLSKVQRRHTIFDNL